MPAGKRLRLVLVSFLAMPGLVFTLVTPVAAQTAPSTAAPGTSFSAASGKTTPAGHALLRQPAGGGMLSQAAVNPALSNTLSKPECPPELMARCHVVLAAYAQDDPNDKSNYGDLDLARRPFGGLTPQPGVGLKIDGIVEHDTEGSLADTLAEFQDPTTYVSATYVIADDGTGCQIDQTTALANVAFHAGNWYENMHKVGIEHVGTAANGRVDFTPAMYLCSAQLDRYLAQRFGFPMDRAHIIGHDDVPAPIPDLTAGMHWDPGPFWNWQLELALMGAPLPQVQVGSPLVTITRPFVTDSASPVTDCSSGTCVALPAQPANFVYLRTGPSATAPLLSDPALHPDGSPGTTDISDWGDTATYGQQYALAGRQGDWTGIWYGGQIGWLHNPGQFWNAVPTRGHYITPRAGLSSIPVYGRAYPEASAYADTLVPVQAIVPLQYRIGAGQRYSTSGPAPTDYYWTWYIDNTFNRSDHTVVVGHDVYYQIQLNHRIAFVRKADVQVVG